MPPGFIGVISDTHGLLRPAAAEALRGAELIVHAGDVGSPEVLAGLRQIAPLKAVRGNVDRDRWCDDLPSTEVVAAGGALLYVLHDVGQLHLDPAAAGFGVVIFGHSHQPAIVCKNGVLFLNPGSAGPRRFRYPVSIARLRIEADGPRAEIVELTV